MLRSSLQYYRLFSLALLPTHTHLQHLLGPSPIGPQAGRGLLVNASGGGRSAKGRNASFSSRWWISRLEGKVLGFLGFFSALQIIYYNFLPNTLWKEAVWLLLHKQEYFVLELLWLSCLLRKLTRKSGSLGSTEALLGHSKSPCRCGGCEMTLSQAEAGTLPREAAWAGPVCGLILKIRAG